MKAVLFFDAGKMSPPLQNIELDYLRVHLLAMLQFLVIFC